MAAVTVGMKLILLSPQPLRAETQPHQACSNISLQPSQPESQISQPAPLMMHLSPPATLGSLGNLTLSPGNPTLQAIPPEYHGLPHRRHLTLQRYPQAVEHPCRYPVPLQVHPSSETQVTHQLRSPQTVYAAPDRRAPRKRPMPNHPPHGSTVAIIRNAGLIGADQWAVRRIQARGR